MTEFSTVRRIFFVVAPNLSFADKTNRKSKKPTVRGVLRCHKRREIPRVGGYFDESLAELQTEKDSVADGGV
jgi:hypothetical protein